MKKLIFLLMGLFATINTFAQADLVQNIKGQITENETDLPLIGANVFIVNSDPVIGTSTDIDGYFKFEDIPVGRYQLACSYIGYKNMMSGSLLLTTGKELVVDFAMEEDAYTIDVEIVATAEQDVQTSGLATLSAQKFDSEVASRYAGSRSDVARMAAGFAGVSANDDSRNDIVIRGNSPTGLLWRLNGIDIPNPSHFGAQGATGGPVSMLNNNLLTNSLFLTGAFPATYGNALSGVFDLTMRKGNKDKFEGLAGISFNGFEAGIEGPLGKNGGSYLMNYRYSVIDLIDKISGNASAGTGTGAAIPRYQDLSFHFYLPTSNLGTFSLFGLGGKSGIDFLSDAQEEENPNLFSGSYQNLYYNTDMFVVGLTNRHYFNNSSYGKISLSYAESSVNTVLDSLNLQLEEVPVFRDDSGRDRLRVAYDYKNKVNNKHSLLLGASFHAFNFDFQDSVRVDDFTFRKLRDYSGAATLLQGYTQWQYKPAEAWVLNLGIFTQHFNLNNTAVVEPRFNAKYTLSPQWSFSMGAGRHSKTQDFQLYLVQTPLEGGGFAQTNSSLGFTKSDQLMLGVDYAFANKWKLKTEFYYQNLTDVPVDQDPSNFSALNVGAEFGVPSRDSLVNEGTGTNYGVEFTLERSFSEGFYVLSTVSLFDSKYKGSDGVERSTAFDNGYIANILTGKEFNFNEKLSLALDTKVTFAGGRKYTPIDLEASIAQGEQVRDLSQIYTEQFKDYFRTDLQLTVRYNMKRLSQSWSIDFQNVFNNQNVFGVSYDDRRQEIQTTYQLGFYPVIEYKLTF